MKEVKEVRTCPFGSECVKTLPDNVIEKCVFYVGVTGVDPQTGEEFDEEKCTFAWLPILLLENAKAVHSVSAEVNLHRKENEDRSDAAEEILFNIGKAVTENTNATVAIATHKTKELN